MPNVGKSTLFNALTNSSKAQAENFPFCTIEPNIGVVPVPDIRLDRLVSISNSNKKIYTTISFVDIQVGKILDHLESNGLDKNTIIVFTSDHGYHLGEHGHWQKQTLFENATRIPLIISAPNLENIGVRSKSPVELIDLYPTLMDLTNINTPMHVVGKRLEPLMKNVNNSVRGSALTRWRKGYSIKTKRYRLTKWGSNGELGYELYDHKNDKNELINLARNQDYNQVMDSLKLVIDQRITEALIKPEGLGRQFKNVKPMYKAKYITFGEGDLDGDGKIIDIIAVSYTHLTLPTKA